MDHHHHQYHHQYHDHEQYNHQMSLGNNNPYNNTINNTLEAPRSGSMLKEEQKMMARPQEARNCPRCNSSNTKFCYYNNYSLSQPRYLCKSCRRYWTDGGSLRNVPVGGGSRKNKKLLPNLLLPPNSSKLIPDLNPPFLFTSSNPNNNDLSLSFSGPLQSQGHFSHSPSSSGGQNRLFTAPLGMIQFRQEYEKGHVGEEEIGYNKDNDNDDDHHHDKMMYHYDDDEEEGRKKREEGGSSNEIWSGIILGGHSGGPTW